MIIIGITGTLGAGKGTIVEHVKDVYGFSHQSVREFIAKEIEKRGLPVNRDTLTEVANDLRATHHSAYIVEELYQHAATLNQNAIIESVRTEGEIKTLKDKPNFYLFAVDADVKLRYDRIKQRKSATDMITFEKFQTDEAREMNSSDPAKQNLKYCIEHSDYVFSNNGTVEDLYEQVDIVMKKLLAQSSQ